MTSVIWKQKITYRHDDIYRADKSLEYVHVYLYSITGYNQSVTGCGSQRRHVVVTQRKLI